MEIIFTKSKLGGLLDAARHRAGKGAAAAEDAVLAARLRRRVRDLEEEIDLQLAEVGALVYATHTGEPSDTGEMQEILTYIDGLYEELAGHEEQLLLMAGHRPCPGCQTMNAPENAFCQECGRKLS